ncbi:unnamed protein product [Onchocerca flexuosa]|uniref:Ovule protein n=1 Tax=Onchocerca flexuosa TaxID=387005 RepID=A0A183GZ98_9BILA|nr:unnamed protein product [Onchocerca flexuosa]
MQKKNVDLKGDVFPNIRLNTLCLFGKESVTGVNHRVRTRTYFFPGPVYVIIKLRKSVTRNSPHDTEYSSDENNH